MLQITHINIGDSTSHIKFLLCTQSCYNDFVHSINSFLCHLHIYFGFIALNEYFNLIETKIRENKSLILFYLYFIYTIGIGNSTKSRVILFTDIGTDNRFTLSIGTVPVISKVSCARAFTVMPSIINSINKYFFITLIVN